MGLFYQPLFFLLLLLQHINRGTIQDTGITRLGNDNWIMAYVHIAHDCQIGNNTIFANNATLGGHVEVGWTRKAYLDDDAEPTDEDLNGEWFDFLMKYDLIWVGTADYVAEKIEKYRQLIGLKHIMLLQQFPGIDYQKILKRMTLFSENVIPRFGADGN